MSKNNLVNQLKKQVVILSVPHMESGYISVAPILLSACLEKENITSVGLDFAADFRDHFSESDEYSDIVSWLCFLGTKTPMGKEILKFIDNYLKNIVLPYDPEYIGLSVFTDQSTNFTELLSGRIRKVLPQTKIIIGGRGLENTYKEVGLPYYKVYNQNNLADLTIVGDAEFSLPNAIKQNLLGIIDSPVQTNEDLSKIPIPNWKEAIGVIDSTNYDHATVTSSKGCIRKCTFCDVANYWPKYIQRDGVLVAQEIHDIFKETNVKKFLFTDNLINGSVSNYQKLNNRLLELMPPKTISYGGYAIFRSKSTMPESDFKLAADAGCIKWAIGIESGSERIRYDMKKNFTDSDLEWSVDMLLKYNIGQKWLLIVGYPSETDEDFEKTLDLIKKYAYVAKSNPEAITLSVTKPFMALENSPIYKVFNFDQPDSDQWRQHFWTCKENVNNTFTVRLNRWRTIYNLIEEIGFTWDDPGQIQGWKYELQNLEKFYNEEYRK